MDTNLSYFANLKLQTCQSGYNIDRDVSQKVSQKCHIGKTCKGPLYKVVKLVRLCKLNDREVSKKGKSERSGKIRKRPLQFLISANQELKGSLTNLT